MYFSVHKYVSSHNYIFQFTNVFFSAEMHLFCFDASDRAGFLNPQIWLANHVHVTGPAFYDTAHGPDFFPIA